MQTISMKSGSMATWFTAKYPMLTVKHGKDSPLKYPEIEKHTHTRTSKYIHINIYAFTYILNICIIGLKKKSESL